MINYNKNNNNNNNNNNKDYLLIKAKEAIDNSILTNNPDGTIKYITGNINKYKYNILEDSIIRIYLYNINERKYILVKKLELNQVPLSMLKLICDDAIKLNLL
jgi:hypothetical protein